MSRIVFILTIALLSVFSLSAHGYSAGDVIEQDGISYKVLASYLVLDSKESPDTIKGPDKFYCAGELMVIKVDKNLRDVVIPPALGRFTVVGLTDSLFFEHVHDRIWLPNLEFVGNACFARLKVGSGALVIHNVNLMGSSVFDELEADLIADISREVTWGYAFRKMKEDSSYINSFPKGLVKFNTKMLGFANSSAAYDNCYSATSVNYKRWINMAFNNDAEFQKNLVVDKNLLHKKKSYSTTPRRSKKGLVISAGAIHVAKNGYPWGSLTRDYCRQTRYLVTSMKKRKTSIYYDFTPVADATIKEGWFVRFMGEDGEVNYRLNGKIIKK